MAPVLSALQLETAIVSSRNKMNKAISWMAIALISLISSTIAETQSVFDSGLAVDSSLFPPFQDNQFKDNVHRLQDLERISSQRGSPSKTNPFLQTHREQCESLFRHRLLSFLADDRMNKRDISSSLGDQ
jgi:hypothetical protein